MAQETAPSKVSACRDPAPWMHLIENTVTELAREDDRCIAEATEWDGRLADLSSTLQSRIPLIVQQRCEAARHRINCGLIASVGHAWASADSNLFIWDYRRQDPQILTVPADSPIISLAICPPRPGVFESSVHLLIVLCTRLTVSLIGMHLVGVNEAFQSSLGSPALVAGSTTSVASSPTAVDLPTGASSSSSLRLMPLEGYSASVDGALFHSVRYTSDGHIFLASAAPQLYELAYSRKPGWFHSKCRLVCHATGLWSRVRTFLSTTAGLSGHLRIIECASNNAGFMAGSRNYVFTVDDSNTIRLLRVRDQAVLATRQAESVAVIEELAVLTTTELGRKKAALPGGTALASTVITHIFPTLGLDGHLCAHVVTAQEKLFFVCSSPPSSAQRAYGFDLKHCSTSPNSTMAWQAANPGGVGSFSPTTMWPAASTPAPVPRTSCLDDNLVPCLHAAGVWITALPVPGSHQTELRITVRVDTGCGSAEAQDLHKIIRLDSGVLDIIEECQFIPGSAPEASLEGEPSAFRGVRSFALLLTDAIQVFSLSFKPINMARPPETAAECCLHFVQLSLPPFKSVDDSSLPLCDWRFDDARTPSYLEQENQLRNARSVPDLHPGRWFRGFLRFLAIVLRPVWDKPIVTAQSVGLRLNLTENKVQRLLARLRPVLQSAKQALAASAQTGVGGRNLSLASVTCRSRLYSAQRTNDTDCPEQVRQLLEGVIDFADRVQQILGLMGVILARRSGYRILQSAILVQEPLAYLLNVPLKSLAASLETLAPVAKLCTALIIESGLTTPSAELVFDSSMLQRRDDSNPGQQWRDPVSGLGVSERGSSWGLDTMSRAAQEVCRELEKQCPNILSLVDLDLCYTRALTEGTAVAAASSATVLSRCVQCVPSNANEERWEILTSSIRSLAAEDMRHASEICVEKIQQLQQSNGDKGRAKLLVEALLSALSPQDEKRSCALIESMLAKTRSLRFADELSSGSSVPFLHDVILNTILNSPRLQNLIEVLLDSASANTEAFLKERCGKDRQASEFLWKYYLKRNRPSCASDVLSRMAEFSDCSLRDRVQYLDMARQAALRCEPNTKDVVEKLSNQLDVATRVQIPLCQELLLLRSDARVSSDWRERAERKSCELQRLEGLQGLYEVATEFGLFHIVSLITDISPTTQAPDVSASNWAYIFFPPDNSPYSKLPGVEEQRSVFPLLFIRRCATFFPREDLAQDDTERMFCEGANVHPGDFRARTLRLMEELGGLTKAPSVSRNAYSVGTLLEYCNCVWFRSIDFPAEAPSNFGTPSSEAALSDVAPQDYGIAWVAFEVMIGKPFHYTPASLVQFYADAISNLPSWLRDLQGMLPVDPKVKLREEELKWHLRRVVLTVLHHWSFRVEASSGDKQAVDDFQKAWPLMDGILKDIIDAPAAAPSRTPTYTLTTREDAKLVRLHASRLSGAEARATPVLPPEVAGQESRQESTRPSLFERSFLGDR